MREKKIGAEDLDDSDLVEILAPPESPRRMLGGFHGFAQISQLLFHQESGHGWKVVGDAFRRGMGAVGRAEGVVDEQRPEACQAGRQRRVVLRFPGFEASVLQEQDIAGAQR
jgi:hypothetical protein